MRFAKAFEEFFYRAETSGAVMILVTHANLIRYLMCRYVDPDAIGPKVMLMYVYAYVATGPCRYRQKLGKIFPVHIHHLPPSGYMQMDMYHLEWQTMWNILDILASR